MILLISCNPENRNSLSSRFPNYLDTTSIKGIDFEIQEMALTYNHLQLIDTFDFSNQTINLNKQLKSGEHKKTALLGYLLPEDSLEILILVDTTRLIPTRNNFLGYILPPPPEYLNDDLDSLLIDDIPLILNRNDRYINNYPIFIINKSNSMVSLLYESISGFVMIQEAQDSIGNWNPIQYWHWNWCGNTYALVDLKPNYYALTRTPKFSGKKNTKMRLKLKVYEQFFYSNEFYGSIDYSQFNFPDRLDFYDEHAKNLMLLNE